MRHNWLASLRSYVDSKFYAFSFPSRVVGHIFACVCEMQLRFCIFFNALCKLLHQCKIELTIFERGNGAKNSSRQ